MSQLIINRGDTPNDRTGDPLREAFRKVNENFTELYAGLSSVKVSTTAPVSPNAGDLWWNSEDGQLYVRYQDTWVQTSPSGNIGGSSGTVDRLTNGSHELVLSVDQDRSYVTFPEYLGEQVSVQGVEIGGSIGLVLTALDGELLLSTNAQSEQRQVWRFTKGGTLETPLMLPATFVATLDSAHMISPIGFASQDPWWEFGVQFQVDPNGTVQTLLDNPFPILTNPGYVTGHTFRFTEADHGIPGFVFDIELNDVVHAGDAGWTANPAVTAAPAYPSTVSSEGALKFTSNGNDWILGTEGVTTFPNDLKITNDSVTSIIGKETVWGQTLDGTTTTVVRNSQVEIDPYNTVIKRFDTQTVDDGILTTVDVNGSEVSVGNGGAYIKTYQDPDGPNNTIYSKVYTVASSAVMEVVAEDIAGETYGRISVGGAGVTIGMGDGVINAQFKFTANGDITDGNDVSILGDQSLNTTDNVQFSTLALTNGDDRIGTNGYNQIALSYAGTSHFPHFIRTRHDDSVPANNAIDFFISDGTEDSAGALRTLSVQKNGVVVGNIEIQGGLKDVEGTTGTTGQVLTRASNGGVKWADATGGAISSSGGRFSTSFDTNANAGIFSMAGTATLRATYGINLETGYSSPVTVDTGSSQWVFAETDGILTVPGVIKPVSTASSVDLGTSSAQFRDINVIGSVGPVNSLTIYGNSQITHTGTGDHDVVLSANGANYTFGANSTLNIPGAISTPNTSQVGSALGIATNVDGGNIGYMSGGTATAMSVAYNADIISTYTVGSTITFQDNTVATITQIDDYGPTSIDIFYLPAKSGTLFPITLKTSNYAAASSANATIVVGSNGTPGVNTWMFGTDGILTVPGSIKGNGTSLTLSTGNLAPGSHIDLDGGAVTINAYGKNFKFDTNGKLTLPQTSVPSGSQGAYGDKAGMVAFSASHIYYCTADYVDGLSDIWVRMVWTETNW